MATESTKWELAEVSSPNLDYLVSVVVAKDVSYVPNGHRFQTLSIYLPKTTETCELIGKSVSLIPGPSPLNGLPRWHVHIHGGAWRDPMLTSASIEPAVAHAFAASNPPAPITAIASINYTLSPFPTHPSLPYDPAKGDRSDPAREGYHPDHIRDVLRGFDLLRTLGLTDDSYILSGHSAGACLSFQSTLQSPAYWGLHGLSDPPRPAALLGMNGLYDLPDLVHGLGASHANLEKVYRDFQSITFGPDQSKWVPASPARFPLEQLSQRMEEGKMPKVIVIDQSGEDQLVPMNQAEKLQAHLADIHGLRVIRGQQCQGRHAAPWEEGYMIWNSIQDVLKHLS